MSTSTSRVVSEIVKPRTLRWLIRLAEMFATMPSGKPSITSATSSESGRESGCR